MTKAQRATRREHLRRARILEHAANLCERGWFRNGPPDWAMQTRPDRNDCYCVWTAIDEVVASSHGKLPPEWMRVNHEITRWNDGQPGPTTVVAHLRASATKYRAAAAEGCHA